ncbi:hypothetical protein [Streptomyces sp. NPDC008121]|uniref:hypothetical protein n=1 Tax=Streptomyces sp. NPDC008121 TaxID=3364809 RepID=UPI0036EAD679
MPVRKAAVRALTTTLCAALLLAACTGAPPPPPAGGAAGPPGDHDSVPHRPPAPRPEPAWVDRLPGVGPSTRAAFPAGTTQALVVLGATTTTNEAEAVLYERDPSRRWNRVAGPWPAHNALRGWTDEHVAGDLRSPIGVFRIGDAGGRLPDPGSLLPYDQDEEFALQGAGFAGEPLEGSFDYVIAIDYNRIPGTSPLNKKRPLGAAKGGGVWIHVDHGGPTQACVSLAREVMPELLRALDPMKEPVIVMGPAADIAR